MEHDWSFSEGPDPAGCRVCDASLTVHDPRSSQPCPGPGPRLRARIATLKEQRERINAEIRRLQIELETPSLPLDVAQANDTPLLA